ncbi:hypothetical protein [Roseibium sp.]|uniref:hypothetical protein n=1 Tax=Roseibium sp. TaxID=1936156 RepID=UPI003B50667D
MIELAFDIVGKLLVLYLLFLFPVILLLLFYSHFNVPHGLREEMLREPFFSAEELARISAFPMSLLATLAVVRTVAAPSTMRRRFGSHDFSGKVPTHFKCTSFIFVLFVLIGGAICLLAALCGVLLEFA